MTSKQTGGHDKPGFGRFSQSGMRVIMTTILFTATISVVSAHSETTKRTVTADKPISKPLAMDVEDFVLDKTKLIGKTVAVTGSAHCLDGDICYISSSASLMTTVYFNASKLNREDRKRLISCNPYTSPCAVTVTGKVTADLMSQIKSETIVFSPSDEEQAAFDLSLPPCDKVSLSDIKSIVEDSVLAKFLHLKTISAKIESTIDEQGHMHCVARIMSNAGEKIFKYYLKREEKQIMILGSWVK